MSFSACSLTNQQLNNIRAKAGNAAQHLVLFLFHRSFECMQCMYDKKSQKEEENVQTFSMCDTQNASEPINFQDDFLTLSLCVCAFVSS